MERIILALDGMTVEKALESAKQFSNKGIWGFKINDLLDCANPQEVIPALKNYGRIFVDQKLHDIPNTVANRVKKLAKGGADFITVHASGGIEMMMAAVSAVEGTDAKILAVTILTSLSSQETNLNYGCCPRAKTLQFAKDAALTGVYGIICSPEEIKYLDSKQELASLIKITPGIRPAGADTNDQKRIADPKTAILNGSDLLVIGRPILKASKPVEALAEINNMIYAGLKEKLALDLFELRKIQFGAFRLKLHEKNPDAPLSPIYLNLRNLPEKIYQTIAELKAENLKNERYGYISGVPNAGNSIADALKNLTNMPNIKLQKTEIDGKRRVVAEQNVSKLYARMGDVICDVVVVDDLITQADSKLEAIEALGLPIKKVMVVVDREQGGREQLERKGYKLEAIFSLTKDLLPLYVRRKKITQETADAVTKYLNQNKV
jgi:orotidine-5'-phosphate decarboxylase